MGRKTKLLLGREPTDIKMEGQLKHCFHSGIRLAPAYTVEED